jgi:hypothetical protein
VSSCQGQTGATGAVEEFDEAARITLRSIRATAVRQKINFLSQINVICPVQSLSKIYSDLQK